MALLGSRPFGPSPPRSAFPICQVLHPSVPGSLATGFFGNQHGSRYRARCSGRAVALSRTQGRPAVAPGTTPLDPIRARCGSGRIDCRIVRGVRRCEPVCGPLPDIAVHIEKAPGVGPVLPHFPGLLKITTGIPISVPVIIGVGGVDIITPGVNRGGAGTAGIFPLGFRGQDIGPVRGDTTGIAFPDGQLFTKSQGFRPVQIFHRTVPIAGGVKFTGVKAHHRLILGLGHLILAQVKTLGEGDIVLSLVGSSARLRGRAAHHKGAGLHPDHIQADSGVEIGGISGRQADIYRAGYIGLIARGVRHRVSQGVNTGGVYIHGTGSGDGIAQVPVQSIGGGGPRVHPGESLKVGNVSIPQKGDGRGGAIGHGDRAGGGTGITRGVHHGVG